MRIYLLYLLVFALVVYAWRDWFFSLCALILLTAVIHHEDFPSYIAGIQGLNPWNILLVAVTVSWLVHRRQEQLFWDAPPAMTLVIVSYLFVLVVSWVRAAGDLSAIEGLTTIHYASEYLIDPLKYIAPALLLFNGCRSRKRAVLALSTVGLLWLIIAVQITRIVPITALSDFGDLVRYRAYIARRVGYTAVSAAVILAGAPWVLLAIGGMFKRKYLRVVTVGAAAICGVALLLTGSRAGLAASVGAGLACGAVRWRRMLLAVPVMVALGAVAFPAIGERVGMGFGERDASGKTSINEDAVSSGRMNILWPAALKQISNSFLFGSGRLAFPRTVPKVELIGELDEDEDSGRGLHPHNMYLEMLLDAGILGLIMTMPLYLGALLIAVKLFANRHDPTVSAIGGAALACVISTLICGLGAHTLYPRDISAGMFAIMGIAARTYLMQQAAGRRATARSVARTIRSPRLGQAAYQSAAKVV